MTKFFSGSAGPDPRNSFPLCPCSQYNVANPTMYWRRAFVVRSQGAPDRSVVSQKGRTEIMSVVTSRKILSETTRVEEASIRCHVKALKNPGWRPSVVLKLRWRHAKLPTLRLRGGLCKFHSNRMIGVEHICVNFFPKWLKAPLPSFRGWGIWPLNSSGFSLRNLGHGHSVNGSPPSGVTGVHGRSPGSGLRGRLNYCLKFNVYL